MIHLAWNPKDRMVPFVGVCWWQTQVIVALWPLVIYFGRSPRGVHLWELRRRWED